jgi:hypothetical protein
MFRHRVRPPTPPLDDLTAERLLRGAPIGDIPDVYRPLARLLAQASGPASPSEVEGSAAAAAAFVTAHHVANLPRRRRRRRSLAASALVIVTLAASTGTAIAATQGALPQPMQQVAHEALGTVGISVPGIARSGDDSGTSPSGAAVTTPTAGATVGGATPTNSPAGALTSPVPSTVSVGSSDPATDIEHSDGDGTGPTNPNAGQGNNNAGGVGNGNGNGKGNPAGTPTEGDGSDTPVNNLPSQSNGKGNGPRQVPPGQAKK